MERSKLRAEWVELVGGSQARQVDAPDPRYEKRGLRDAARQLDVPEPSLRRDIRIASLSEEAQVAAVEHGLDDGRKIASVNPPLAEEIERIFQTKVEPMTIFQKARRMSEGDTNVSPDENPPQPGGEPGFTGVKIDPADIVEKIDSIVAPVDLADDGWKSSPRLTVQNWTANFS